MTPSPDAHRTLVHFNSGQVAAEAEALRSDLAAHEAALQVEIAGSYRRRKEIVHDLDLLVATKEPEAVTKFFVSHPLVESVIAQGPTKSSVRLAFGSAVRSASGHDGGIPFRACLFHREQGTQHRDAQPRAYSEAGRSTNTGSRSVPASIRRRRRKDQPSKIPSVQDEADLYRAVDLDFIPPELRENCGEFEAAKQHSLPKLIEKENLRGTFHCHTVASDGHNTLEEMAEAARELGLEYLGIADHSRSSVQGHGIAAEKLLEQVAAIRKLNKTFDGFRLFAGVECDILRDGSLDFPDEVLSQLDYVVASVHSVFNLRRIRDDRSA